MEAHGSNIQAPADSEGGAVFRIRLPLDGLD
jgi:K+-sensing histidine kinase KdpD